jgi:hypothetical protein
VVNRHAKKHGGNAGTWKSSKPIQTTGRTRLELKKPAVKAAVNELDRTEFAILDEILTARRLA